MRFTRLQPGRRQTRLTRAGTNEFAQAAAPDLGQSAAAPYRIGKGGRTMNSSRRSYLDTLNAGRQRRPNLTLDELNRSLANLEERLQQPFGATPDFDASSDRPAEPVYPNTFRDMVREVEQARTKEDGVAAAGRIAGEIKNLRSDLGQQRDAQKELSSTLRNEFDSLRREIERGPKARAELDAEFARLATGIQKLADRSDDSGVVQLKAEMAQVKGALEQLAREDSLRSMEGRWDALERRLGAFETKLSGENRSGTAALENLHTRLEGLNRAVGDLPTSQSMRGFEDRLRNLAGVIDQFARNQTQFGPEMLNALEERLDEISRGIQAAAAVQTPDPKPFERIEAGLSAVSKQVEGLRENDSSDAVMQRLTQLSTRVDELAAKANLPAKAVEQLGNQVAIIAAKLDKVGAPADPDFVFRAIEQRFDTLAAMLERRQGDAAERAGLLFRDLERRLDEVVDRLDAQGQAANPAEQNRALTAALDERFTDFAKRFENKAAAAPPMSPTDSKLMRSLEAQVTVLTEHLAKPSSQDKQLQALAPRLEGIERALANQHEAVLKAAREAAESTVSALVSGGAIGLETTALARDLRALEAQVSILTEHLSQPFAGENQLQALAPRLEGIERSLERQHDAIMRAAREAAERTAGALAASGVDGPAVAGLAQDLKSLETLTRRSDDRNAKTFEAIHDTLIKIVERLGSLETEEAPSRAEPTIEPRQSPRKIAIADAPSLDFTSPPEFAADAEMRAGAPAVALALDAGINELPAGGSPARGKSLLGGLSRALGGGRKERAQAESVEVPAAPSAAPDFDLDEPLDNKLANQPLAPGSGGPDLGAIMRRVRDERAAGPRTGKEGDAAKSDFIAAARRAAQAAAAEAEILKRQSDSTGLARGGRLGKLLQAKRKSVLMAVGAIMIALAGIQASKFFTAEPVPQMAMAESYAEPVTAAQATEPAAETAALAPITTASVSAAPAAPAEAQAAAATPPDLEGEETPAAAASADAETGPSAGALAPVSVPETATAAEPNGTTAPPETAGAGPEAPAAKLPNGLEVPKTVEPAALREAAANGDAVALWTIGSRLADTQGKPADLAAAAKWFEAAADLGLAPAQYRIGSMYEKGTGVERNPTVAKTWYQLAADAGNASAMHNLAVLYAMGAAGGTDNELAVRWFTAAAEHGVKDSQFNLGILAAKGVGTSQDLEASYKWFALVAKSGDKDAAAKRDEVAATLKPDALARARATAELWKAKPLDPKANTVETPAAWGSTGPATTASVDMKAAVKTIQLILAKNGYDAGGTDGVMGARTKAAIVAFQKDNKLPATGEVDDKLVKALLARK